MKAEIKVKVLKTFSEYKKGDILELELTPFVRNRLKDGDFEIFSEKKERNNLVKKINKEENGKS